MGTAFETQHAQENARAHAPTVGIGHQPKQERVLRRNRVIRLVHFQLQQVAAEQCPVLDVPGERPKPNEHM